MYILIDEKLPDLAEKVREEVRRVRPDETIVTDPSGHYEPGSGVTVVDTRPAFFLGNTSTAFGRFDVLHRASRGVRFWGEDGDSLNPLYAGNPESAEKIVVDAAYAEMRAKYLDSFNIPYLGRSYVAPRTVILVDSDNLFCDRGSDVEKILGTLPRGKEGLSAWSSFALASAPDLRKLRKFTDDHFDVNFLAYSTKDKNRLKKLGIEFGEIDKPVDEAAYGVHVRSVAALLRPFENSEIDFVIEVPNS
jgi:hypothetical protein